MKTLLLILLIVLGFVFSACEKANNSTQIKYVGLNFTTSEKQMQTEIDERIVKRRNEQEHDTPLETEEKYSGLNPVSSTNRTKPIDREMMQKMITSETGTPLDRKFQETTALERLKRWKRNLRWYIVCKRDRIRMDCKGEHDGMEYITKFECSIGEPNYAKFAYYDCISERGRRIKTMCQITKLLDEGWKEYFCAYWQENTYVLEEK